MDSIVDAAEMSRTLKNVYNQKRTWFYRTTAERRWQVDTQISILQQWVKDKQSPPWTLGQLTSFLEDYWSTHVNTMRVGGPSFDAVEAARRAVNG
jgi:hypothetical protein